MKPLVLVFAWIALAAADAETLFRVRARSVHDADGRTVATLNPATAAPGGHNPVALAVGEHIVFAYVGRDGLRPAAGVLFTSTDCSGQAYMIEGRGGLYATATIAGPRWTVFRQTAPFSLDPDRTLRSAVGDDGGCRRLQPLTYLTSAPVKKTGVHLRDRFTPPFGLRATRGDEFIPGAPAAAPAPDAPEAEGALYSARPVKLVDAAGTVLGATTPYIESVWWDDAGLRVVLVTGSGVVLVVQTNRDYTGQPLIAPNSDINLHFLEPDCTGTAYIVVGAATLAPRFAVHGPRWTVWKARGTPARRTLVSHRDRIAATPARASRRGAPASTPSSCRRAGSGSTWRTISPRPSRSAPRAARRSRPAIPSARPALSGPACRPRTRSGRRPSRRSPDPLPA